MAVRFDSESDLDVVVEESSPARPPLWRLRPFVLDVDLATTDTDSDSDSNPAVADSDSDMEIDQCEDGDRCEDGDTAAGPPHLPVPADESDDEGDSDDDNESNEGSSDSNPPPVWELRIGQPRFLSGAPSPGAPFAPNPSGSSSSRPIRMHFQFTMRVELIYDPAWRMPQPIPCILTGPGVTYDVMQI